MDRSVEVRVVVGRSSHSRGGVLPLQESDRGCAAGGHDAAGARGEPEHRLGSDVGTVVVSPEAVFQREGRFAVEDGAAAALRRRGVRISFEPRGPPGAAWLEGGRLSGDDTDRAMAVVGPAGSEVGEVAGGGDGVHAFRLGLASRGPASCRTTRCRGSTGSARTSTSWT